MLNHDHLPEVDPNRVHQVYDELKSMQIRLDPNPIEFGPRKFNANIARLRSQLDRVEQLFLQISEDLHMYKRAFNETKSLYELDKNELMLNDLEVRQERSQKEREAKADTKLRNYLDHMRMLELQVYDLEQLMVVIKAKRTDLKDKQGRMRDQMKLIEHDISMGARWGSHSHEATAFVNPQSQDLDSMLNQLDTSSGFKDPDSDEDADEESPPPQTAPKPVLDLASLIPQTTAPKQVTETETASYSEHLDRVATAMNQEAAVKAPSTPSIEDLIDGILD